MNPSLPFPTSSPSFTFLPQTPNPNPPPSSSSSSYSSSSPDLATTLSTLKTLLNHSRNALNSLSKLPPPSAPILISCPYNPHHRMPPQHLFRHSLTCPSPLDVDLGSLRYPHTLNFSPQSSQLSYCGGAENEKEKVKEEELCFSIADYFDGSNFFYRDCPGVVSSLSFDDQDRAAKWMFTLPVVLSVECANLVGSNDIDMINAFRIYGFETRLLASDLWAIRCQVEMWSDYPVMYSYIVLNAIVLVSLLVDKESDLKRWVIMNSPHYGVVIDEAMRDHIFLLFRLSMRAIEREAFRSANKVMNKEVNGQMLTIGLKNQGFECPVLVQVMKWLASQLSILYGEVNGKLLAINMFKQYLLGLDSSSLLISMKKKEVESTSSTKVPMNSIANASETGDAKLENPIMRGHGLGEKKNSRNLIFVYQVAAAVAALHERAVLEEKIKALRLVQPFPIYQRVAEHAYLSKRAEEERRHRSNYRSIVEHDGFLMQPSYNQETSKTKTREELLAEERDYKRRRMSYHGKKLKRSKIQVARDIINEYMEDIKRAGGIGCFVKGSEERANPVHYGSPDERSIHDSMDSNTELLHGYRKQSNPIDIVKSSQYDHDQHKQNLRGYREPSEDLTRVDRNRKEIKRNSEDYRNHGRYDEQSNRRRELSDIDVSIPRHRKDSRVSSNVSKYNSARSSSSTSASMKYDSYGRKNDRNLETLDDQRRQNAYRSHKSDSVIRNAYDDRYDPSESPDDDDRYDPSESHDDADCVSKYADQRKYEVKNNNIR